MSHLGIEAKYDQIKRLIREEIVRQDLKPGDRLPTRQSMRQRWGVANDTVEHAIRALIEEGILTARQGSGTYVARVPHATAPRTATFTIDVLIPRAQEDVAASHSPHTYLQRLEGITTACERHRVQSRLRFISPDDYLHADALLEAVTPFSDAVIFFKETLVCRLEPYLRAQKIPFASLGQSLRTQNTIQPNLETGYRQVFRHLLRHGIRQVSYCGDRPEDPYTRIPFLTELARICRVNIDRTYWHHSEDLEAVVDVAAPDLIAKGARAVLCRNDALAVRLMRRLTEMGVSMPDQMAVIGYDDTAEARRATPALSTVRAPFGAEGEAAVGVLAAPARRQSPDFEAVRIDTEFVARGSTLPDPKVEEEAEVPAAHKA